MHACLNARVCPTCDVVIGDHVHFGDGLRIGHIHELVTDPIDDVVCVDVGQVEIFFLVMCANSVIRDAMKI